MGRIAVAEFQAGDACFLFHQVGFLALRLRSWKQAGRAFGPQRSAKPRQPPRRFGPSCGGSPRIEADPVPVSLQRGLTKIAVRSAISRGTGRRSVTSSLLSSKPRR
jgi:hypothetical protein